MKHIVLTLSPDEARTVLEALDFHHDALAEEHCLDDTSILDSTPEWLFETIETLTHVGDVLEGALVTWGPRTSR